MAPEELAEDAVVGGMNTNTFPLEAEHSHLFKPTAHAHTPLQASPLSLPLSLIRIQIVIRMKRSTEGINLPPASTTHHWVSLILRRRIPRCHGPSAVRRGKPSELLDVLHDGSDAQLDESGGQYGENSEASGGLSGGRNVSCARKLDACGS